MDKNKIIFGLEQFHIAFFDTEAAQPPAWKVPIAIAGIIKLSPSAQGEESKFYADNILYHTETTNDGYTATLEAFLIPDIVKAEMLGWEIDDNGMLVEVADGKAKKFALMGQVKGDKKNRRFVYYDCKASRPSKEYSSKTNSVTPSTDSLNLTILPIEVNSKKIVKGVLELSETNAIVYNGFFDAVTLPKEAAA